MEDHDVPADVLGDAPAQDFSWYDFDIDAFFSGELSQATDAIFDAFFSEEHSQDAGASIDGQQELLAFSEGKKRRPHGTAQPRVKRQRIQHCHVCEVHRAPSSKPAVRCFGKWSSTGPYKGARCERNVTTFVDGQLPVCPQHRAQIMEMRRCEAILECGFPCNEIVPWKAHAYPLCDVHWSRGKCHLMGLPVEIRLMIYQYLIPDRTVSARWPGMRWLREDLASVSTAMFRVSKTVHEEFADYFYGETTFAVEVTNDYDGRPTAAPSILMLYAIDSGSPPLLPRSAAFVQRARLVASVAALSRPTIRKILTPGTRYDFKPWTPPLALRYFQRIRKFLINIVFDTHQCALTSINSQGVQMTILEAERNLMCDDLHRLVKGLIAHGQIPLRNLDISFLVQGLIGADQEEADAKAMAHCEALINPIRRLRARSARVKSVTRASSTPILSRTVNFPFEVFPGRAKEAGTADQFVRNCCAELTGSLAPPPMSPVLVRFGQLVEVVSNMSQHAFWRDTDIEEMEFLLSNGRSAREANDMKAMMSVFREIFEMLKRYHSSHRDFMKQMAQSFEMVRSGTELAE
jgi:hypothetical protein